MDLDVEIRAAGSNPQRLEQVYQAAREKGQADVFRSALLACFETSPDNLLYAAWFYRFQQFTAPSVKPRRGVNWIAAVPLSILTGLIFWVLSDIERLTVSDQIPQLLLWWSPIATMSALIFLIVTSKKNFGRALALGLGLLAVTTYAILLRQH